MITSSEDDLNLNQLVNEHDQNNVNNYAKSYMHRNHEENKVFVVMQKPKGEC